MSEVEALERQDEAVVQQAQAVSDMAHDVHLVSAWHFLILIALVVIAIRMPKCSKGQAARHDVPGDARAVKAQIASMRGRKGLFTGNPFVPASDCAATVEAVVEDFDDEWVRLLIDSKKGREVRIVRMSEITSVEELVRR